MRTLARNPAVALFVDRARLVKRGFKLTEDNAPAVAAICRRLDGLPLAIELAAARIDLLPPKTLLDRLSSRLKVLTVGDRDSPARHQTLRGAIEWSYALLNSTEQTFLERLSVFAGGWTLNSARDICGRQDWDPGDSSAMSGMVGPYLDTLDVLGSLLDKNLIGLIEMPSGDSRFVMLETIQEFALDRLVRAGRARTRR